MRAIIYIKFNDPGNPSSKTGIHAVTKAKTVVIKYMYYIVLIYDAFNCHMLSCLAGQ